MPTQEEITALKNRLHDRQAQRKFDRESDEALALVHSRKPMSVIRAEAKAMPPDEGFSGHIINRCTSQPSVMRVLTSGLVYGLVDHWVFWFSIAVILWATGQILF